MLISPEAKLKLLNAAVIRAFSIAFPLRSTFANFFNGSRSSLMRGDIAGVHSTALNNARAGFTCAGEAREGEYFEKYGRGALRRCASCTGRCLNSGRRYLHVITASAI